MRISWVLLFMLTGRIAMAQIGWDSANSLYASGEYQAAFEAYNGLIGEGKEDGSLYYNAGCAAYKMNLIPEAIWSFEMALMRKTGDADIIYNLEMARARAVDKLDTPGENVIDRLIQNLFQILSPAGWRFWAIVFLWLGLAAWIIYLFTRFRKVGFFSLLIFLAIAFILFGIGAAARNNRAKNRHAILFAPSVYVKSGPAAGQTDLFILHEGIKVKLLGEPAECWQRISLGDDKTGWVKTEDIRVIE